MGFSAGGEVVGLVAYGDGIGDAQAADPIDRVNGRPDFTDIPSIRAAAVPPAIPKSAPPASPCRAGKYTSIRRIATFLTQ